MPADINTTEYADSDIESRPDAAPIGDGGAGLTFWILILMSVTAFAPCMILPAWREYQAAVVIEQTRAAQVELAEKKNERQRRLLDAIHNDPAVVARLAKRELAYRDPGEVVIPVSLDGEPAEGTREDELPVIELDSVRPPVAVERLVAYLPAWDYDSIFCANPNRRMVMALSVGLFVAAFLIFWPKAADDSLEP